MSMQVNVHEKAAIVVLNCAFSWGTVTDKEITDENIKDKGAVAGSLRTRKTLLPQASGAHVDTLRSVCTTFYNRVHLQRTFSTPIKGQRIMPQAVLRWTTWKRSARRRLARVLRWSRWSADTRQQ
jgi:hypothetical protein